MSSEESPVLDQPEQPRLVRRRWPRILGLLVICGALIAIWLRPSMVPEDYSPEPVLVTICGQVIDELGQPVLGAEIRLVGMAGFAAESTSSKDGRFEINVPHRFTANVLLGEKRLDDDRVLRGVDHFSYKGPSTDEITLILKPEQQLNVRVVDGKGDPVADCRVLASAYMDIGHATTDEDGRAVVGIPADKSPFWIVGSKSGVGLDYYENYQSRPGTPALPLPEFIELQLQGTKNTSVRVVDSSRSPVPGVAVYPWLLKLNGKRDQLNTAIGMASITNDDGVATFEVPSNLEEPVTYAAYDERWRQKDPFATTLGSSDGVIELERNALVRGHVRRADGRPAAGILVIGSGTGASERDQFMGTAVSGDDGVFEMWVSPRQTCMFAVDDPDQASPTIEGVYVVENELRDGVDLQLVPGTLVQGQLTRGKDEAAASQQSVTLTLNERKRPAPWFVKSRSLPVQLRRWTSTDETGEYSFRVADGDYHLLLPIEPQQFIPVSVAGQKQLVFNGHINAAAPDMIQTTGIVRDSSGAAASQAEVWFCPDRVEWQESQIPAGADGEFSIERTKEKTLVYARSHDGTEAVFSAIDPDATTVELVLAPAAEVTGTLLRSDGTPAPGCVVRAIIWHADSAQPRRSGSSIADESVRTDDEGNYVLKGLPPGTMIQLLAFPDGQDGKPAHGHVNVRGTGTLDAKEMKPGKDHPLWRRWL